MVAIDDNTHRPDLLDHNKSVNLQHVPNIEVDKYVDEVKRYLFLSFEWR